MHEFVLSGERQKKQGVRTLDIAKRLLDYGVHPPTVYFPLIVDEAIMIEPTETESKETLDEFVDIMLRIVAGDRGRSRAGAQRARITRRCAGWTRPGRLASPNLCWCPPVEGAAGE